MCPRAGARGSVRITPRPSRGAVATQEAKTFSRAGTSKLPPECSPSGQERVSQTFSRLARCPIVSYRRVEEPIPRAPARPGVRRRVVLLYHVCHPTVGCGRGFSLKRLAQARWARAELLDPNFRARDPHQHKTQDRSSGQEEAVGSSPSRTACTPRFRAMSCRVGHGLSCRDDDGFQGTGVWERAVGKRQLEKGEEP